MRILLFGKNGQLGRELKYRLSEFGHVIAPDHRNRSILCGDFTNLAKLIRTVKMINPDIIVNAAAYTDVGLCEKKCDFAYKINAEAPSILANEARLLKSLLVHYSTDYVFDGKKDAPWKESDIPNPLGIYGKSKLYGENGIRGSGCNYLIFRTSWLYGFGRENFPTTILNLAKSQNKIQVVDDQLGSPTSAKLLSELSAHSIYRTYYERKQNLEGLYHISASGKTSRFAYAQFILSWAEKRKIKLQIKADQIQPIPSHIYSSTSIRPLNSALNCSLFQKNFGISDIVHWKVEMNRFLKILTSKSS